MRIGLEESDAGIPMDLNNMDTNATSTLNQTANTNGTVNGLLNGTVDGLRDEPNQGIMVISDQVQYYLDNAVAIPLCSLVSAFGIVTNLINIALFIKQGLQRTVSITLFSLALSDLGMCVATFTSTVFYGLHLHDSTAQGHLSPDYTTGAWIRGMFYSISSWITFFSSVERCVCVALPFKMRAILMRGRTAVIILLIYIGCLLFFVPVFIGMALNRFAARPQGDSLRSVVEWFHNNTAVIQSTTSTFSGIFTPTVTQLLILVNTYIMTSSLRSSATFRSQSSSQAASDVWSVEKIQNNISSRDRTLVKMVTIICIIFIACNFPVMLFVYGRRLVPGLDFRGHLKNLHTTLLWMTFLCGTINSSVNIFVYYRVSSLYRDTFKAFFTSQGQNNNRAKIRGGPNNREGTGSTEVVIHKY